MCSITGVGERLHTVLEQTGSILCFPWQQKASLTYNGENDVSTFSRLFLIRSFLYKGQSINSGNGSISQKTLLESESFMMQTVDKGNAYSCVKYCVFITTRFDAMRICIQQCGWL